MPTSIVIPWRTDHGWRQILFTWVARQWRSLPYEVCVGTDPSDTGPINVSRLLNRARARATGDVLVVASADHVPNQAAVDTAAARALVDGWAPIFGETAGTSLETTVRLLSNEPLDLDEHVASLAPFCTALLAVRADVWDDIGGWPEEFVGWGCEDVAFRAVLETLYPITDISPPYRTYALWHQAAPRDRFDANATLLGKYLAVAGDREAMRTVVSQRST